MKQNFLIHFLSVCLAFGFLVNLASCANMIPPGGGPRDTLPPVLVSAIPKDSAVNVKLRNITLTFDEYINLQNPQQSIIISPLPAQSKMPNIDFKLRNLTIKLKDSLEPNTTYSIDFGDAVRDVNEGNIARNLHYVFSTGNSIDYNTYSGKVILAETGKIDSNLVVILHKNLSDTAPLKLRPRYFTRVNGQGEFRFQNLPPGSYAVYAVANKFTFTYGDSSQMFAFKDTPVLVSANTAADTLYAFEAYKRPAAKTSAGPVKAAAGKRDDKRIRFSADLQGGEQDLLNDLHLTFNKKLTRFDSARFVITDTGFRPLSGFHVSLDSTQTVVSIRHNWKQEQHFILIIDKEAVADSLGTELAKADTVRFTTKPETDYGSIRIRFLNIDTSRNPIVRIMEGEKLVDSEVLTQKEFNRKLFRPGAYQVSILYDSNKNGKWDTGHFWGTKRQPEIVVLIPKQIAIRANWDNEVDINL
ncbi:MAG: Ig-like domain-containing protein [Bacteroidota bacterium]|nr:Ig-like domain-containing protein [Bacteroidota bacterium]